MGKTALFASPGCRRPTSEGIPWAQFPNSCLLSWDLQSGLSPELTPLSSAMDPDLDPRRL